METDTILQCKSCDYKTKDFGDFINHPCRLMQLEKQKNLYRAKSRVKLDSLLFCPTCGTARQKADEEKRRAGGYGWMTLKDRCLKCQTPYDEDWSFLDKFYCLKADYTFHLQCPTNGCSGVLYIHH